MKINAEPGEDSWTPVNSLSNNRSQENLAEAAESSKGRSAPLNIMEQEEREPKREELQRIIQLMDGFKASKVMVDSTLFLVCTEAFPHLMSCAAIWRQLRKFPPHCSI